MKRVLLSTFLVAGLAGAATAQIGLAPEVGISIANLRGKVESQSLIAGGSTQEKSVSADPTFGLRGGVNLKLGLTERLSIQPGLFYVAKGGKDKDDFTDALGNTYNTESKISVSYLELPVNVVYNISNNGGGGIFVFGGPYLGYAFGGKEKINVSATIGGVKTDTEKSNDLDIGSEDSDQGVLPNGDDWKALDYGFQVGLGYTLPIGLYAKAQYQMGLADVKPDALANTTLGLGSVNNTIKNWGFAVTVGYWLFGNK